jgi:hypothetical protein
MIEHLGSPITAGAKATLAGFPVQSRSAATMRLVGVPLCPDLLRYELLGEADGWRGRAVRAFFWLLRVWPAR